MRYLIVNPEGPWVQGDLHADAPEQAALRLEARLSAPTSNEVWWVFEAPEGLPPGRLPYGNDHPAVVEMLRAAPRLEVRNSASPEQKDLFAPSP